MISEIIIVSSRRTKKTQAEVEQRVAAGLCLKRNGDGMFCCDRHGTHRGRCHTHYQQFRMLKLGMGSQRKKAEFESTAIVNGEILECGEVADMKADSLRRLAMEIGAS